MSEATWHPLRCLTRTDADVSTLFYGFFLVDSIDSKGNLNVSKTIPLYNRAELSDIQQGLFIHVLDSLTKAKNEYTDEKVETEYENFSMFSNYSVSDNPKRDDFGSFVITTAKANRYHCFWRGNESMMLIGLSVYPFPTFARQVFDCLGGEAKERLVPTLIGLCECPILPACNLEYRICFSTGDAKLSFSAHEQVIDVETYSVALRLLTPTMLIRAWEAVILERKLLVLSSRTALLEPCCEFIRRLALPLALVSPYMPNLSEQAIAAIEAPFPYLYGCDSKLLARYKYLDLSDTIIVNLDQGLVEYPTPPAPAGRSGEGATLDLNSQKAPQSTVKRIYASLNNILLMPLTKMVRRPPRAMEESRELFSKGDVINNPPYAYPLAPRKTQARETIRQGDAVIDVFIRENLSLLGAQRCSLKTFVRDPKIIKELEMNAPRIVPRISLSRALRPAEILEYLGYDRSRGGLVTGFMQYVRGSITFPVWVEASEKVFSVFTFADELPVLQVAFKHIDHVAAIAMEPLGLVFELKLSNCILHKFQVHPKPADARSKWMAVIERNLMKARKSNKYGNSSDNSGDMRGNENMDSGDYLNDESLNTDGLNGDASFRSIDGATPTLDTGASGAVSEGKSQSMAMTSPQTPTESGLGENLEDLLFPVEKDRRGALGGESAGPVNGGKEHGKNNTNGSSGRASPSPTIDSSRTTAYPDTRGTEEEATVAAENSAQRREDEREEEREEREIMLFRHLFHRTQLLSFVESEIDPEPYDKYLSEITFEEKVLIYQKVDNLPFDRLVKNSCPIMTLLKNTEALSIHTKVESHSGTHASDDGVMGRGEANISVETSLEDIINSSVESGDTTVDSGGGKRHRMSLKPGGGIFNFLRGGHAASAKEDTSNRIERNAGELSRDQGAGTAGSVQSVREEGKKSLAIMEHEDRRMLSTKLEQIVAANQQCKIELKQCLVRRRMNVLCGLAKQHSESKEVSGAKQAMNATGKKLHIDINVAMTPRKMSDSTTKRTEPSTSGKHAATGATKDRSAPSSLTWFAPFSSGGSRHEGDMAAGQEEEKWLGHIFGSVESFNQQSQDSHDGVYSTNEQATVQHLKLYFLEQFREALPNSSGLSACYDESQVEEPLHCVLSTLLGHLKIDLGLHDEALSHLDYGGLSTQSKLVTCISTEFVRAVKDSTFHPASFLNWATSKGNVSGLHAYRLLVHFLHEVHWKQYTYDEQQEINEALNLNTSSSAALMRNNYHGGVYGSGPGVELKGRHDNKDSVYTWVEKRASEGPSPTLNNSVTCTGSTIAAMPCELSIYLATKICELVEAYMESPAGYQNTRSTPTNHRRLDIQSSRLKDIQNTSAYARFRIEVCELQRVQLAGLRNPDELCLFFLNLHNTLTLHAIIVNGSPGSSALERMAFSKSAYFVGDMVFSLYEIEHVFLRHMSKKASIYGFTVVNPNIKSIDPRAPFRLNTPKPFITFALFNATQETPPFRIFTDPLKLDEELRQAGEIFVRMYVKARRENFTVTLPGVFKFFFDDFGGSKDPNNPKKTPQKQFIKLLIKLSPDMLRGELEAILDPQKNAGATIAKPRLLFNTKMLFSDPVVVL